MESIPIPELTLSFSVDLKIEYNPFKGKTNIQDYLLNHIDIYLLL